jgi:hypothetical protein
MGRLLFYPYTSEEVKAADHASSLGRWAGYRDAGPAGNFLIGQNTHKAPKEGSFVHDHRGDGDKQGAKP